VNFGPHTANTTACIARGARGQPSNCNCLVSFIVLRRQTSVFVSIEQLPGTKYDIWDYIIISMSAKDIYSLCRTYIHSWVIYKQQRWITETNLLERRRHWKLAAANRWLPL